MTGKTFQLVHLQKNSYPTSMNLTNLAVRRISAKRRKITQGFKGNFFRNSLLAFQTQIKH